jgi:hypothetical protein
MRNLKKRNSSAKVSFNFNGSCVTLNGEAAKFVSAIIAATVFITCIAAVRNVLNQAS